MARKVLIQVRRGLESDMGKLDVGEMGFTTDNHKLYIGSSIGNVLLVNTQTSGDMTKSIYDINNDGIIDRAKIAESVEWIDILNKPIEVETQKFTWGKLTGGFTWGKLKGGV